MKLTERLNIPSACGDCPTIERLAAMHDELSDATNNFIQSCMRGEIEQALLQSLIDSGMSKDDALDTIADRAAMIQAENLAKANELDETLDAHVSLTQKILDHCPEEGAMSLRRQRSGRQVAVVVCMSDAMNLFNEFHSGEPVTVHRKMVD